MAKKLPVVDEKTRLAVDASPNVFTLEELRSARVIVSINEKLYGQKLSVTQVAHENKVYRQEAAREAQELLDNQGCPVPER